MGSPPPSAAGRVPHPAVPARLQEVIASVTCPNRCAHGRSSSTSRLAGRLKDMVRRGGENTSAAQVEHVLGQHPAVLNAAVVPVPDDLWGEEVKAFLTVRPGQRPDAELATTVIQFARQLLAPFKVPRFIHFVQDFPMTPSERVAKPVLIQRWEDRTEGLFDMVAHGVDQHHRPGDGDE